MRHCGCRQVRDETTRRNSSQPYANTIFVVAAFSSQPPVGLSVTDEMSLIESCRPRVFGDFNLIYSGSQILCQIFWRGFVADVTRINSALFAAC